MAVTHGEDAVFDGLDAVETPVIVGDYVGELELEREALEIMAATGLRDPAPPNKDQNPGRTHLAPTMLAVTAYIW
jgi:hypothetical protein